MAGGRDGGRYISSVYILPPGATAWTPVASLPRPLEDAQATIFGGKFRVYGGEDDERSYRTEVMIVVRL